MSKKEFENTLAFWRLVEALSPQEVPKLKKDERESRGKDLVSHQLAMWLEGNLPLSKGKVWSFTVFGGLIDREIQVQELAKKVGRAENVFDERLNGKSCLFSLRVDERGRPSAESFVLSMSAWATGVVMRHGVASLSQGGTSDVTGLNQPKLPIVQPAPSGLSGFDSQSNALRNELAWRVGQLTDGEAVTMEWLHEFARLVAVKCGVQDLFPKSVNPVYRVMAIQVPEKKSDEALKPVELINSFFIRDLNRVQGAGFERASAPLRTLMEGQQLDDSARVDVRRERARILANLEPKRFPLGCWPSEHPLVWSQQLAINSAWEQLRNGEGMFAVNGPPGTGKTTLLRDFVAAIVVERATVLSELGARAFQSEEKVWVGQKEISFYPLHSRLAGHSIVVASSNNGAVENLSLELPSRDAIDPKWLKEPDFYRELASNLLGKEAWGLLAGKLGNSGNRQEFATKFYWPSKASDGTSGMKELLTEASTLRPSGLNYDSAKKAFDEALRQESVLREELQAFSELPTKVTDIRDRYRREANRAAACEKAEPRLLADHENAVELQSAASLAVEQSLRELEAVNALRPGALETLFSLGKKTKQWRESADVIATAHAKNKAHKDKVQEQLSRAAQALRLNREETAQSAAEMTRAERDLKLATEANHALVSKYGAYVPNILQADEDIEKSSPWSVPAWRQVRIKVFLAALNLHRAFVESNADKALANLRMAIDMFSKALPSNKARITAYDSLALVCPVISTALASVPSMFGDIDTPAIGWLLIDEAGQAPPQACAGALWRSKRAIVVGDPLQLEPVVTIPHTVEAALAQHFGNVKRELFPTQTSAQRLADNQMVLATRVGADPAKAIWVGAPLRVHRRCDDPMFSVSNEIAYDGLMVHHKKPTLVSLPKSQWVDVQPSGDPEGHWVPAEGAALSDLLQALQPEPGSIGWDIFLISPFKDVVQQLERFGWHFGIDKRMVGTVHTTQGKEASTVILVLGGGTPGARNWAAGSPNLLNVAVSRAKSRLYVIGDRQDWSKRPFFSTMGKLI